VPEAQLPSGLAKHRGVSLESDGDIMNKSRFSSLPTAVLTTVVLSSWTGHGTAQEIALSPLQATEVAKDYRADALKLMPVVNDKNDPIGRVNDFIFGKDGSIFVVLAVGDFTGLPASSSPFPSVASNWTIPPATLYCREQVARRWKNCRFSSPVGEPLTL
jgi:hypothetical protein